MPVTLDIDRDHLAALCRRHHVAKLELFGSRAQGTARPDSDVDLLVTFEPDRTPSFLAPDGFVALTMALEQAFGHPVDVLTRDTVEKDRNGIFRAQVLENVEVLYGA